jgi:hypothetical protein
MGYRWGSAMSRQILCLRCAMQSHMSIGVDEVDSVGTDDRFLSQAEHDLGYSQRIQFVSNNRHGFCDACSSFLIGKICCCVTIIPPTHSVEEWESNYGKLMSREEVKLYLALAKP